MVDVNWTVLVQIANFVILIFILNAVLYKPIRNILLQRKAKIDGLNHKISSAGEEAEEKNQAFAAGVKQARAKGQKAKEALLQAAGDEQRELIAQINVKAKEDLDVVKRKIAEDTQAVKTALEKEIDTFANAITQKILGRAA
jgi:F-type H+-transporting ATPase subunit b